MKAYAVEEYFQYEGNECSAAFWYFTRKPTREELTERIYSEYLKSVEKNGLKLKI